MTLSLLTLFGIVLVAWGVIMLVVAWKPTLGRAIWPMARPGLIVQGRFNSALIVAAFGLVLMYLGHSSPAMNAGSFTLLGIAALVTAALNLVAAWKPGLSLNALRARGGIGTTGRSRRTSLLLGIIFLVIAIGLVVLGRGASPING